MPSSTSALKSSGTVSDQFSAGIRVLVVDDDPTCLMILDRMLHSCFYEVTKCNRAEIGLSLLRENKNGFDIVLSDVHMQDMDGFKLLDHIGLEMDLPVISKYHSISLDLHGSKHEASYQESYGKWGHHPPQELGDPLETGQRLCRKISEVNLN